MPTQSTNSGNNQGSKSATTQGGTHEQHVKAGQQSHKNDGSGSASNSKSASGSNSNSTGSGKSQRSDSKSSSDSKHR
ncbi:hypothetical protein [Undibacterium sp. TJN19]|uniref:hypothetical protein n=1 Tax=Undibacterium sp. TJN19 TaxID=3413055 RepID=UPI003BF0AF1C